MKKLIALLTALVLLAACPLTASAASPTLTVSPNKVEINLAVSKSAVVKISYSDLPDGCYLSFAAAGPFVCEWNKDDSFTINATGTGSADLDVLVRRETDDSVVVKKTVKVTVVNKPAVSNEGRSVLPPAFDWRSAFSFPDLSTKDPNPNKYMAHNIYVDPNLSQTSGKFKSFSIAFKADYIPVGTYWSLCNGQMDLSSLGRGAEGGGFYAGLQHTKNGMMGIIAFWDTTDSSGRLIQARRVYPEGTTNRYDNEGNGGNYIAPYNWKAGQWYRMTLRCYEDPATGHTFVDMWIMDLSTGIETHFVTFDTMLSGSCFTGGMSQFMENYDYKTCDEVRAIQVTDIRVKEVGRDQWISLPKATVSVDTWYGNKKGSFAFGATDDYFWGITSGHGPDLAETPGTKTEKSYTLHPSRNWFS